MGSEGDGCFLRLENDMEYSSWLTDKISYYQYLEYQMMSPTLADDMDKMMVAKDRISKIKPQLEDNLKKKEAILFPDARMRDEITEMEMKMMDGKEDLLNMLSRLRSRDFCRAIRLKWIKMLYICQ